jgi:hypothetical protein
MEFDKAFCQRLEQADKQAIAQAIAYMKIPENAERISEQEIVWMWMAAIDGLKTKLDRNLIDLTAELGNLSADTEAKRMLGMLSTISVFPAHTKGYSFVIQVGAAIARHNEKGYPDSVDREWYVRTARDALLAVLEKGYGSSRKYAAEALVHFKDPSVRLMLGKVARDEYRNPVGKAASESCSKLRLAEDIQMARDDREFLLKKYEPVQAQYLFIDLTYSSIEAVLGARSATEHEIKGAVHQLSTFAKDSIKLGELFSTHQDQENLETLQWSVENALFHALNTANAEIKETAGVGLERIGGGRVLDILGKIVKREEKSSETYKAASETLALITGASPTISVLPPLKPSLAAQHTALPRKLTR